MVEVHNALAELKAVEEVLGEIFEKNRVRLNLKGVQDVLASFDRSERVGVISRSEVDHLLQSLASSPNRERVSPFCFVHGVLHNVL